MLGLILASNILCNYWRNRDDATYKRMKALWEAEKHTELLAFTSHKLKQSPANSLQLMYKTMALMGLGRLDEAKAAAEAFSKAVPTMRKEAIDLREAIAELLASEG